MTFLHELNVLKQGHQLCRVFSKGKFVATMEGSIIKGPKVLNLPVPANVIFLLFVIVCQNF